MAKWTIVAIALLGCACAEPPVGYSYSAPSIIIGGGGHGGGGHGSQSSGGYSYSSGGLSSGGHYTAVPVGHQSSEGYHIDPHLLEKIRHIILKDEIQNEAYQQAYSGGGHGHGGHGVSSSYGPPAPVYGVPHDRIVGVELEHVQQGIQVAQYHQEEESYSHGGGYPSASGHSSYSAPSSLYSAPSHGYQTIGAPSGSYGVPSSSYGAPHHRK